MANFEKPPRKVDRRRTARFGSPSALRYDRTHWRPPPDVMSKDEIRWWLTALRQRYGWGTRALGRTLGLANPAHVSGKASGKQWIYPTGQIRMSRQLKRIISGELVCIPGKRGRVKGGGYQPGKAVIADHPVPLRQPLRWHFNLAKGRFEWQKPLEFAPALPNFRTLLDNPPKWKNP